MFSRMKGLFCICVAAVALMYPRAAGAQVYEDFSSDLRGRIGAEANFKLADGLHVFVSEEARVNGNFSSFDRLMTSAGLSYKPIRHLKLGVEYTFMSMYDVNESTGDAEWDLRHRANVDVTGLFRAGAFRFSLRERYQLTARTGDFNHFQSPAVEHVLRTRAKVSYKCRRVPLEPYASIEARLLLNGVNTDQIARKKDEIGLYAPTFDQVYFNRCRAQIGLEYMINSHHAFDFYILGDYVRSTKVDTNAEGKLKKVQVFNEEKGIYETLEAIYHRRGFNTTAGIAYKYSF